MKSNRDNRTNQRDASSTTP